VPSQLFLPVFLVPHTEALEGDLFYLSYVEGKIVGVEMDDPAGIAAQVGRNYLDAFVAQEFLDEPAVDLSDAVEAVPAFPHDTRGAAPADLGFQVFFQGPEPQHAVYGKFHGMYPVTPRFRDDHGHVTGIAFIAQKKVVHADDPVHGVIEARGNAGTEKGRDPNLPIGHTIFPGKEYDPLPVGFLSNYHV